MVNDLKALLTLFCPTLGIGSRGLRGRAFFYKGDIN